MTRFQAYLTRARAQHGNKFDSSDLASEVIPYYETQQRIEVSFRNTKGQEYERKRGRVGITTGWQPCFILLLTARSRSSCWTLSPYDVIVRTLPKPRGILCRA